MSELPDWYRDKRQRFEEHFETAQMMDRPVDFDAAPSKRYGLGVTYLDHGPNTWAYSEGAVFNWQDHGVITVVRRNYGNFHHGWIEGHPNGHDYLLCGEDYQGQTVIELDTGRRADYIPPEAEQGYGFCMAEYTFHRAVNPPGIGWEGPFMEVLGCYWACPYERVTYDFSEPLSLPWPELSRREAFETDGEDLEQELRNG